MAAEQKYDEAGPALTEERAVEIAQECRKAMKGFGTDEKALIAALCPLTFKQAAQVVAAYKATINRDLVDDLKSETGGHLEDTLVGLLTPPGLLLATRLRKSVKGLGTDEELLVQSLFTASDEELRDSFQWGRRVYETILPDDIESDLGGKIKELASRVMRGAIAGRPTPGAEQVEEDVLRLYKAGEDKIGVNSSVFIDVIGSNSRAYVARVADAYARKYGKSLVKVCKSEFSSWMRQALIYLIQEPHVSFADLVHKSGKGLGTDETLMCHTIVSQRHRLVSVNEYFLHKHEKNLSHYCKSELGGDVKRAIVAICDAHT